MNQEQMEKRQFEKGPMCNVETTLGGSQGPRSELSVGKGGAGLLCANNSEVYLCLADTRKRHR